MASLNQLSYLPWHDFKAPNYPLTTSGVEYAQNETNQPEEHLKWNTEYLTTYQQDKSHRSSIPAFNIFKPKTWQERPTQYKKFAEFIIRFKFTAAQDHSAPSVQRATFSMQSACTESSSKLAVIWAREHITTTLMGSQAPAHRSNQNWSTKTSFNCQTSQSQPIWAHLTVHGIQHLCAYHLCGQVASTKKNCTNCSSKGPNYFHEDQVPWRQCSNDPSRLWYESWHTSQPLGHYPHFS